MKNNLSRDIAQAQNRLVTAVTTIFAEAIGNACLVQALKQAKSAKSGPRGDTVEMTCRVEPLSGMLMHNTMNGRYSLKLSNGLTYQSTRERDLTRKARQLGLSRYAHLDYTRDHYRVSTWY